MYTISSKRVNPINLFKFRKKNNLKYQDGTSAPNLNTSFERRALTPLPTPMQTGGFSWQGFPTGLRCHLASWTHPSRQHLAAGTTEQLLQRAARVRFSQEFRAQVTGNGFANPPASPDALPSPQYLGHRARRTRARTTRPRLRETLVPRATEARGALRCALVALGRPEGAGGRKGASAAAAFAGSPRPSRETEAGVPRGPGPGGSPPPAAAEGAR